MRELQERASFSLGRGMGTTMRRCSFPGRAHPVVGGDRETALALPRKIWSRLDTFQHGLPAEIKIAKSNMMPLEKEISGFRGARTHEKGGVFEI